MGFAPEIALNKWHKGALIQAIKNDDFWKIQMSIRFYAVFSFWTISLASRWMLMPAITRSEPVWLLFFNRKVCPQPATGFRMTYWGYSPSRHDVKWHCPAATGKEEKCTCEVPCSSSPYGRCLYTKPDWDIRLYPPVARGTDEYKKTYNKEAWNPWQGQDSNQKV